MLIKGDISVALMNSNVLAIGILICKFYPSL
nr:MAG TPA: hypothetical protein [Caudoviricetes sp.]DAR80273.1 MAG TPA: hypothetical protein [Caudoviricetes sp.]DAV01815.1 MAG TPA: hypothetical protein [Caudoviricetes sp.]